jgi:tetratricopeptide (TPR) repeat protein/predicted Ser/Thr protein kinase
VVGSVVQHYRIVSRLGAGGMGEVYRAEDLRLGREVALKFLPAALKADPESRARLLNEARAASVLRSPNIAITYDISEHAGSDFIVMEFVEGELLSARVSKGPLPPREAVEVGLQVSDALDEAYARGIVHRDIKSSNLMRTPRGVTKILDFGLAKITRVPSAIDVTQSHMTAAGMVLGTVSYMAPEQALGLPVDHRADLFSLGVVLFELLTGRLPFEGPSPTAIIDRILHETPAAVSRFTPVPPALDALIARALEKRPELRYQTSRALHDDLREIAAALDNATRPIGIATVSPAPSPARIESSVAVMTFANITREPADDWIGTGIAETVSADLKNIQGVTVIGRARIYDALRNLSTEAHLNDAIAVDIGRRLGATWIVVGGFQRIGQTVRITANLVDVSTASLRRTVKVDGRIDDIFGLQDRIVYELSQGLNVELVGSEIAGIERQETRSVQAYEAYARGMMNLRQATRDSMDRAIAAFEDATRYDPEYANAWAALGGAVGLKGSFLSLDEMLHKAIDLERRAIALQPSHADARVWLASALVGLRRFDEGIAALKEAIALDPENGQAHQGLARAYWIGKGDFEAAVPEFERSIELNPEAGYSYLQLGLLLAWLGDYDRAAEVCRRAVDLQEQYLSGDTGLQIVGAHARLGYVYYLRGDYARALREYERELAFIASSDHALRERTSIELNVKVGAAYHRKGQPEDAKRHFDRALKAFDERAARGADDPFTRYYIACLHALRGDQDRALESLERVAATLPALTVARARRDPDLDPLRSNPRFIALLRG